MKSRLLLSIFHVARLAVILAPTASAATITWSGSGANSNWSTALNWTALPVNGDSLVFTGTTLQASVNNQPGLTSLSGITFGNGGFSITGNAITLTGNIDSTGSNTYGIATTLGGNRTITSNSGTLTLTNTLGNSGNLLITGAGNILLSGSLTGSGSLSKSGTGTLTFNALNTYLGATSILDGAIALGRGNSLNALFLGDSVTNTSGKLVLNGFTLTITSVATAGNGTGNQIVGGSGNLSTLTLNTSLDNIFSGTLGGAGTNENNLALVKSGTGILTLSGTNTFIGGLTINAGSTVKIGSSGALNNAAPNQVTFGASANGSKLQLNGFNTTLGGLSTNPSAGSPVVENNHATNVTLTADQSSSTTYAGILQDGAAGGTLSLKKTGIGTLTLSGVNTYSGTTTISQGVLSASNLANALGSSTSAIVLGDATNTGTLSYTGTSNSFTRGFTINAGGGQIDSTTAGQILTLATGNVATSGAFSVGGVGSTSISSNITGTGSLRKTGAGNLILSGFNSYSGPTSILNGTIILGVSVTGLNSATTLTLGDFTANTNGVLKLNGNSQTLASLWKTGNGTGNSVVGGNAVTSNLTLNNAGSVNFGGILGGNGINENNLVLTKTSGGLLTLSGSNTYAGGTTISAGTLAISAANNLGATSGILNLGAGTLQATANITSSRAINLTDAASTLLLDTGITYTDSGVISGTAALNLTGSGTLVVSGTANTYAGGTFIKNGILTLGTNNALPISTALILGNASINGKLALNGNNQTVSSLTTSGSGSSNQVVNGKVTVSTLTVNNSANISFGGILGGIGTNENAFALTKSGTGILTLTNSNTYNGDTTISAGILQVGIATTLPSGVGKGNIIIGAAGTLDVSSNYITINGLSGTGLVTSNIAGAKTLTVGSNDQTSTFGGIIQNGNGIVSLTKIGTGTLTLSGANTYTGLTTVSLGTLQVGNIAAIPSGTGAGNLALTGALDLNGNSISLNGLSGAGGISSSVAGAITLSVGANDQTASYSGIIANGKATTLGLTKVGTGTLTLSGVNTYSGNTNISAGTLKLSGNSTLPTGAGKSDINIATGAFLDINGRTAGNATINGLTGTGSITNTGAAGGLTIGNNNATGTFNGIIQDGAGTASLTKTGTGTFTLTPSTDNTFTGGVTISGGVLQAGNSSALNSLGTNTVTFSANVAVGTKFQLNGNNINIAGLAGTTGSPVVENANANGATFTIQNTSNFAYAGVIQDSTGGGALSLLKNGTGTQALTGTNLYTGGTTISGGILSISKDSALGATSGALSIGSGKIQVTATIAASPRNLTLADSASTILVDPGMTYAESGTISGSGNLNKESTGIFQITGSANTYSGGTSITAGLLDVTTIVVGTPLGANSATNNIAVNAGGNLSLSNANNKGSAQTITVTSTAGALGGIGFSNTGLTQDGFNGLSGMFTDATSTFGGVLGINISNYANAISLSTLGSGNWFLGSAGTGTFTGTAASLTVGTGNIYRLGGGGGTLTLSQTNVLTNPSSGTNELLVGSAATNGNGTVILAGSQIFGGKTTVTGGAVLRIGSETSLGNVPGVITPGYLVLNNGTLRAGASISIDLKRGIALGPASGSGSGTLDTNGYNFTYSGIIANNGGTGGLTKTGTGTLLLSGNQNTYTGATNLNGGITSFTGINDLGAGSAIGFNGGTLLFATGNTTDITSRTVTTSSAGGAILDLGSNDITFASSGISGSGLLTKLGSGALTLNAVNTYTGATNIINGTVKLGIVGALPATSALTLNSGVTTAGTLDINGLDTTVSNLAGNSTSAIPGRIINSAVGSSDVLTVNSTGTSNFSGLISGNGGTGGTISLVKTGIGTFTLGGANTYSNGTTVSTGTLAISSDANLGTAPGSPSAGNVILSGGTTLSTTATMMTLNANRGLAIGPFGALAATLAPASSTTLTYNGIIANSGTAAGGLTKSNTTGTLILGGVNIYAGNTTISGGLLSVGNVSAIPSGPGNGNVSIASSSGGALDLNGNNITINGLSGNGGITNSSAAPASIIVGANDQTSTFSGIIVNGNASSVVSLGKTGAGTLTLSGASTYTGGTTISGGSLSISADTNIGTAPGSPSAAIIVINGGTLSTSASLTIVSNRGIAVGPASGSGSGTLAPASGTTLTYGGIIANNGSGTGGLTKSNTTGTLLLSGANNYSGDTLVSGGTIQLGNVAAIPSGTGKGNLSLASGGALDLNNLSATINGLSGAGTVTNSLTGPVTFTAGGNDGGGIFSGSVQDGNGTTSFIKTGAGILTLSGLSTYSGNTTVSAGTLKLGMVSALPSGLNKGNLAVNGTLDLAGFSTSVNGLTGSGIVSNSSTTATILTAGLTDQFGTFSGSIQDGAGSVALTKTGTGTLSLSGNNTYSGATLVSGGSLIVGSTSGLSGNSTINLGSAAVLDLNGFNITMDGLLGAGTVSNNGATASTLLAGAAGTSSQFDGVIVDGTSAISLNKTGAGILTLAGINTYSGTTTIGNGTVSVANPGIGGNLGTANSAVILGDATNTGTLNCTGSSDLTFTRGFTVNSGGGQIMIASPGKTLTLQTGAIATSGTFTIAGAGNAVVSSIISGSGGFTKANTGALVLSATNTYTGDTTITSGTLQVTNAAAIPSGLGKGNAIINGSLDVNNLSLILNGISGSGTITNRQSAAVSLTAGDNNASGNFTGVIQDGTGTLSLVKTGTGTLTLSGNNTYTGATNVNAGTLLVNGALSNSDVTVTSGGTLAGTGTIGSNATILGTHSPGNNGVGTQSFTGELTYNSHSIFAWEIQSPTSDTGLNASNQGSYDKVNVGVLSGTDAVFQILLDRTNNFDQTFWDTDKTWNNIFSSTNSPNLAAVFSGFAGSIPTSGIVPGQGQFTLVGSSLNWSAVPEPKNAGILGLLLVAGNLHRQRRSVAAAKA